MSNAPPPAWALRVVGLLEGQRPQYGRDDYRTPEQLTEQARMVAEDGPRCDTCRWWRESDHACERMEVPGDAAPVWASDEVDGCRVFPIYTDADFGCVLWEPTND